MPTIQAQGYDLAGILNYLAGITNGPMDGGALAANAAWGAINGHGAKAASLTATGQPQTTIIGGLNLKNGTWGLDINLVCNQLAGTTGLEAALALRTYAGLP